MVVPHPYRPLAALLLGFDAYFSSAASGLIFTEMMAFIVTAMVSWEDFVSGSGWRSWISPVALGLAISIQQDSWFLVPCFLVAVYQEAVWRQQRPWPTTVRYATVLAAVFLFMNAPFIVWGPAAWAHGILEPLTLSLMPLGQGLIGVTTYLGIGGGNLTYFSVTSFFVLAVLLSLIGFAYRRFRFLVPIAPAIVLWFSTRSLSEYVLIAAYSILAAMCTWRRDLATPEYGLPSRGKRRKRQRWMSILSPVAGMRVTGAIVLGTCALAATAALILAMTSKAPLSVQVLSYHSTGQEQTVDSVSVGVRNSSTRPERPVFVVEDGPYVGTPWILVGRDTVIPPHDYRVVKILAPNTAVMPSLNSAFRVAAFTSGPPAVSSSPSFLPNNYHTLLTPFGLPNVVAVGKSATVTVQVLNRLGSPVDASGIEVLLGQEVYSPTGLFATENSINGQPAGQSPVSAVTNSQGLAVFQIRALQTQQTATTLQAWLGTSGASGYSNRVIIWFGYPTGSRTASK